MFQSGMVKTEYIYAFDLFVLLTICELWQFIQ